MDEPDVRVEKLRERAEKVRERAIKEHRSLIGQLEQIWDEMNELAAGRPEVRRICDDIAGDIARLEKLDLSFDTEWFAEAKLPPR